MSMKERVYRYTDKPMTWTRAVLLGLLIWVLLIIVTGQVPSYFIYWVDANVTKVIDWTTKIPGVEAEGFNPKQVQIARDVIANGLQMGGFTVMLVVAYFWQKAKQKRVGQKDLQDTVKGYMSGK
ncbi:MAG: hypothetical protein GEU71_08335 [Actinobacteria bacterium]|jgi:Na+/H+ antiporter NhaC|nr:hypothetical protein [Actinomycetota bacterium]